jgi:hypothetical protein
MAQVEPRPPAIPQPHGGALRSFRKGETANRAGVNQFTKAREHALTSLAKATNEILPKYNKTRIEVVITVMFELAQRGDTKAAEVLLSRLLPRTERVEIDATETFAQLVRNARKQREIDVTPDGEDA